MHTLEALLRRDSEDSQSTLERNGRNDRENFETPSVARRIQKRRQVAIKRRREALNNADAVEITAEDENSLVCKILSLYDDLVNRKAPIEAYYSLITSLRGYFEKQTWNDCVDNLMKCFMKKHVLLSSSRMAEKYLQACNDAPLSLKMAEYKIQVLLHIYSVSAESDSTNSYDDILDNVANLLRVISFMGDVGTLRDFFDDIFDQFVDLAPRHLAHLYDELNQPIPEELLKFSLRDTNDTSFYEPLVVPSPSKHNHSFSLSKTRVTTSNGVSCKRKPLFSVSSVLDEVDTTSYDEEEPSTISSTSNSQTSRNFNRSASLSNHKHHRLIELPASAAKRLKVKQVETRRKSGSVSARCYDDNSNAVDYTEVFEKLRNQPIRRCSTFHSTSTVNSIQAIKKEKLCRTPNGKSRNTSDSGKIVPETPAFHQISNSEKKRRRSLQAARSNKDQFIVNETPPKSSFQSLPEFSVRHSPRQHASTRALYGNQTTDSGKNQTTNVSRQILRNAKSTVRVLGQIDENEHALSPGFVRLRGGSKPSRNTSSQKSDSQNSLETTPSSATKHHNGIYDGFVPATDLKSASNLEKKSNTRLASKKLAKNLSETFSNEESSLSNFSDIYNIAALYRPTRAASFSVPNTNGGATPSKHQPRLRAQKSLDFHHTIPTDFSNFHNNSNVFSPKKHFSVDYLTTEVNQTVVSKSSLKRSVTEFLELQRCPSVEDIMQKMFNNNRKSSMLISHKTKHHHKSASKITKISLDDYFLPTIAQDSYFGRMREFDREKSGNNNNETLFYARDSHSRRSIFDENGCSSSDSDGQQYCSAPKNRSGRTTRSPRPDASSFLHAAHYLLNAHRKNPSCARELLELRREAACATSLRIVKRLRRAPRRGGRSKRWAAITAAAYNNSKNTTSCDESTQSTSNEPSLVVKSETDVISPTLLSVKK